MTHKPIGTGQCSEFDKATNVRDNMTTNIYLYYTSACAMGTYNIGPSGIGKHNRDVMNGRMCESVYIYAGIL